MIPQEIIEDIRKRADIVQIISSYISVTKKGNTYMAICPFHADKNPSLHISPDKQIYKCFVCGAGGNVFTFVQQYEKCSFMDAVRKVADMIGYHHEKLEKPERVVDLETSKVINCLKEANNFYHFSLSTQGGEKAKKYFEDRNISQDMIDYFSLGYSLSDAQITISVLRNKGYDIDTIDKAGILVRNMNSYADRFTGRVMFPIYNEFNEVVGFSGRRITDSDEAKYVNSPNTILFNKSKILYNYQNAKIEAKKEGYIYIVEGFMDVFALYKVGIKSCVALMGTAFTNYHAKLLRRLNVDVRLCLDGDDAGQNGMAKMMDILDQEGVQYHIVNYNGCKDDPDEILQNKGPVALKELLNQLVNKFDFIFDFYKKNNPLSSMEDRKKFANDLLPFVSRMNNQVDQDIIVKKICQTTGIEVATYANLISKRTQVLNSDFNVTVIKSEKNKRDTNQFITRLQYAEKQLMYFILTSPDAIDDYQCSGNNYFIDNMYETIWNYVLDISLTKGNFELADFISTLQQNNSKLNKELLDIVLSLTDDSEKRAPYSKETLAEILEIHNNTVTEQNKKESILNSFVGKTNEQQALILEKYMNEKGKRK